MIITETKISKIPFTLTMDEVGIAETINKLRLPSPMAGNLQAGELSNIIKLIEHAFYRLQKSEDERIEIISKMPKKKDRTFEIDRVYVIQSFDELYYTSKEYNTTSKFQIYAKAIDDHNGILEFGMRKE